MARHGAAGNNSDQAALDLLKCLNNRCFEVWRFHDWDWSLDDISLSVGPSTYNKTLASTTGEVLELSIQGKTDPLRRYSRREYLRWKKQPNVDDVADLIGYTPLGRDSSGNIKLRFFAAPANIVTIEGWGKKRFVKLTTSDWTTELLYYPVEMQDVIYKFVLADAYKLAGDNRSDSELRGAHASLNNLVGEEESPADLENTSPPPDYCRSVRKTRRG